MGGAGQETFKIEFLTVVLMSIQFFQEVTLYHLTNSYRPFGGVVL